MNHGSFEESLESSRPSAQPSSDEEASMGPDASSAEVDVMDVVRILRKAGGSVLVHSTLHAQLVRLEWAQEKGRLLKMLMLTLVGFACLICTLLALGALALALSWETRYRMLVVLGLIVLYAGAGVGALLRFRTLSEESAHAFAATRAEIAADIAMIRNSL